MWLTVRLVTFVNEAVVYGEIEALIVIAPFDPVEREMLLPAMRYGEPSLSLVSDPLMFGTVSVFDVLLYVNTDSPPRIPPSLY